MPEPVELVIELNAKLDGATRATKALNQVEAAAMKTDRAIRHAETAVTGVHQPLVKVNTTLASTAGGMVQAAEAAVPMAAAATTAAGGLASLTGAALPMIAAMAGFAVVKGMASAIYGLADEALHAAGEAQRTRYSFQLLLGIKPGNDLLEYLDNLAEHTEFTDGALKGMAGQLLRAGYAGEGLKRALAATVDLAARTPDKMAGAAEAIGLLSKIQLKGGISERELVGARIDPAKFFARVAAQTGIGIKDVEKKIQEGKVKVDILKESLYSEITAGTGKALGAAGVGMKMTFLAQLEKAHDIIPNLLEELENTGGLKTLTQGLMNISKALSPNGPAGKAIIAGLSGMLDWFGRVVSEVDFRKIFDTLVDGASKAWTILGPLFSILGSVASVVWDLGKAILQVMGPALSYAADLAATIFSGWSMLFQLIGDAVSWLGPKFGAIGGAIVQGLIDGVMSFMDNVVATFKSIGNTAISAFKSVLGIASPSKVFAGLGADTSAGFVTGVQRAQPDVAGVMHDSFSPGALMSPMMGGMSGLGGGPQFEANVTINISAAAGGEGAAHEQAEQVGVSVRRAMESIFEQWAAEGGAV